MTTHFIVHDKADTVGVVVVEDVKPGQTLTGWVMEGDGTIQVKALDAVPLGHKVALKDIKKGDTVIKYGNDIGKAVADIAKGAPRPRPQRQDQEVVAMAKSKSVAKRGGSSRSLNFLGYRRSNGRVGVRNHVIILPLDDLSNAACEAVANNIKGTMALPHPYGRLQFGEDLELHFRTLIGTGASPNVAACVVIGIEPGWTKRVVDGIAKTGKPVEGFSIEGNGDIATIAAASRKAKEFVHWAHRDPARGVLHQRAVGLVQVRRVRHDVRPRVQPDGRQPDRQDRPARRDDLLRRDVGADRRRGRSARTRARQQGRRHEVHGDVERL